MDGWTGRGQHDPQHTRASGVFGRPCRLLRAGFGIGYCQAGVARRDPELVPVLPDLVLAEIGIWLVMHEDLRTTRRIRALFDHLAGTLTGLGSV